MSILSAEDRLVKIIHRLSEEKRDDLNRFKENYKDLERSDFIWHYLLQSFSTMGRSAGWAGLIGIKANYDRLTYPALKALSPEDRLRVTREMCKVAKVRMPNRKSDFIIGCFDRITEMGGPEAAKAELLALSGREAKIRWLKEMPGIGEKYARNIMMDVYHEDFRDSIAIDIRIAAITQLLGLSFQSYMEHENFYLNVAKKAGVNGWELDRILYNFRTKVEQALA